MSTDGLLSGRPFTNRARGEDDHDAGTDRHEEELTSWRHWGDVTALGRWTRLGRLPTSLMLAFRESRPLVLAMFGLRFAVGVAHSGPAWSQAVRDEHVLLGAIAWVSTTAGVYLLNGISDVDGDRVNGSTRPLASRLMSLREARTWCVVFFAIGLLTAVPLGHGFMALCIAAAWLGWMYSFALELKRYAWSASLLITAGGLATYLAGARAAGSSLTPSGVTIALVMALWMGVVGNAKDFGDAAGDAVAGRRTLPLVVGRLGAAWVIGLGATLVACSAWLFLAASGSALFTGVLTVAAIALVVLAALAFSRRWRGRLKEMYRVFMVSQLLANAVALGIAT